MEAKDPVRIGITVGDVNGIGMEVIMKTFMDARMLQTCIPVVYGSVKLANYYRKLLDANELNFQVINDAGDANTKRPNLINCLEDDVKIEPGSATAESGKYALASIDAALKDVMDGKLDAIVTAPIHKQSIAELKPGFTGHTGYLAERSGAKNHLMLMVSPICKMGLVTEHLPLSEVSQAIGVERVYNKIMALNQSLMVDFSIRKPRIAVMALNPHAGEGGQLGKEESEIIAPAIRKANDAGVVAIGPYPADGFFGTVQWRNFDAVLSMYHDQGLIPFKSMAFDEGVNYTAGLPFVRTSPDHGTGFDIAGKNQADETSFRHAVYLACDIFRSRQQNEALRSGALRAQKQLSRAEKD